MPASSLIKIVYHGTQINKKNSREKYNTFNLRNIQRYSRYGSNDFDLFFDHRFTRILRFQKVHIKIDRGSLFT